MQSGKYVTIQRKVLMKSAALFLTIFFINLVKMSKEMYNLGSFVLFTNLT